MTSEQRVHRMSTCPSIQCPDCGEWFQLGGHDCLCNCNVPLSGRELRVPCPVHGARLGNARINRSTS